MCVLACLICPQMRYAHKWDVMYVFARVSSLDMSLCVCLRDIPVCLRDIPVCVCVCVCLCVCVCVFAGYTHRIQSRGDKRKGG